MAYSIYGLLFNLPMSLADIPAQKETVPAELRNASMPIIQKYCSPAFQKHLFAVEAAMRALAKKFGGDPDTWGICGLLHDIDWEDVDKNAELHCAERCKEILSEIPGMTAEVEETIISHYEARNIPLDTLMKRALFCVDELTGLIQATARMNPDGLTAVKVKSVKKKFKDKKFAAGVDREIVKRCEDLLELPLEELIAITLQAMQECEEELV